MATINFPTSPALNDPYTINGRTWAWNGSSWINTTSGYVGSQGNIGYTGSVGFTGSQGATPDIGEIRYFSTAPTGLGWLKCDGAAYLRSAYPAYEGMRPDSGLDIKPSTVPLCFFAVLVPGALFHVAPNSRNAMRTEDGETWTLVSDWLPVAVSFRSKRAVSDSGAILYIPDSTVSGVAYYSPDSGETWVTTPSMPAVGAALPGVYSSWVLGTFNQNGACIFIKQGTPTAAKYNPVTNTWTAIALGAVGQMWGNVSANNMYDPDLFVAQGLNLTQEYYEIYGYDAYSYTLSGRTSPSLSSSLTSVPQRVHVGPIYVSDDCGNNFSFFNSDSFSVDYVDVRSLLSDTHPAAISFYNVVFARGDTFMCTIQWIPAAAAGSVLHLCPVKSSRIKEPTEYISVPLLDGSRFYFFQVFGDYVIPSYYQMAWEQPQLQAVNFVLKFDPLKFNAPGLPDKAGTSPYVFTGA